MNSSGDRTSSLLFVYGSLKRGRANHHELGDAEFLAEARTAQSFALRVIAGYPALVAGSLSILGELYRIPNSALPALDEFEGLTYVRREIQLATDECALAYLSRVPDTGEPYPGDEWEGSRV